ncbi:hypothetical protein KBW81_04275 [Loktanella salsilacus]|uniref:hypothetical protein n=1 Tax=Loktanella salsilacus TaxID=195913 RepID=UPI0020B77C67|nr:hypothetical protein [Loktanella salsilacus]UTH49021.1 hypothetical protein KBW81_04275 [Loktanella salsilacus]
MIRLTLASSLLALLAACGDGQPLFDENGTDPTDTTDTTDPTDTDGDGGDIDTDGATPPLPGTDAPSPDNGIFRYEDRNDKGGGLVTDVSYDAANDTFTVDNLGFDGANTYQRVDAPLNTLGVTRVFAADEVVEDTLTGKPVEQIIPYRALYGVSDNQVDGEPRTSFAIVRTGGYREYGFGGYVYERNGGVVIPTEGQATFSGQYAGLRVFDNATGLEYTTGNMSMDFDFDDFNANDAVKGQITDRRAINQDGTAVALRTADGQLLLPNINWVIQEGSPSLNENGEITSEVVNTRLNDSGAPETYESGTFYGVLAGDATRGDGGEIVGIITIESTDPRYEGITAQETGGAILYR